jgi:type I restriction enzyme S subunit
LKDVAQINRSSLPEDTDPDFTFRYIDIGCVDRLGRILETEEMTFADAPSRARRIVAEGDSIVSMVRTYLRAIAQVPTPANVLIVSTGFATITAKRGMHPRFLYWWLRSKAFVDEVVARSIGVSYPAVNGSDIADIAAPVPPCEEQERIAHYLDAETARIDELIVEQEAIAALAEERHRALVLETLATTAHDVSAAVALKRAVKSIQTGGTPPTVRPEYFEEGTVPWYSPSSVDRHLSLGQPVKLLSKEAIDDGEAPLIPAKATMMVTIGATIGRVAQLLEPGSCNQQMTAVVPGDGVDARFLAWTLWALGHRVAAIAPNTTLPIFTQAALGRETVWMPTGSEQRRIADVLDESEAHLMALLEEVENQGRLLREHRQALITAAVTGGLEALGRAA